MDPADDPVQLYALLHLQATETTIRGLRRKLDDLVEQQRVDAAEAELRELIERREITGEQLSDLETGIARIEREVKILNQRLDAERQKMYSGAVTNAREEQSMKAEIDTVERLIGEREDEELGLLEQQEALESQISALDEAISDQRDEIVRLGERRDKAAEGLLAEIAATEATREKDRGRIDPILLERYDPMAEKRPGRAVGVLAENSCSMCAMELPKAEASRLRGGDALAECPSCAGMLVTVPKP